MVDGGGGALFPVVFSDGERESNIGEVIVNPATEYKPFQLMLSHKIGVSPNQISIYLVDRIRNPKSSSFDDRRRTLITGKVDFGLICRQKDCCFLVVLKRSRKSRNRRERTKSGVEFANLLTESEHSPPLMHSEPENLILLRRNQLLPLHNEITQSKLADLSNSLQSFSIQRDNYHVTLVNSSSFNGLDSQLIPNLRTDSSPGIEDWCKISSAMSTMINNKTRKAFCGECENAEKNGSTMSFHPCVNDAVITQFSTRMGPIARPNKSLPV